MDLVMPADDPLNNAYWGDESPPPPSSPSAAHDHNAVSDSSPDSCSYVISSRVQTDEQSCWDSVLDTGDTGSGDIRRPLAENQNAKPVASNHDESHDIRNADSGISSSNGHTPSATLPTASTSSGATNVSMIEESVSDNANQPAPRETSRPPALGNEHLVQPSRSATMTAHDTGNPHYQPQAPYPWSPYRLHSADEARRALADMELQRLSDDDGGEGTPGPEYDLDLSD